MNLYLNIWVDRLNFLKPVEIKEWPYQTLGKHWRNEVFLLCNFGNRIIQKLRSKISSLLVLCIEEFKIQKLDMDQQEEEMT